MYPAQKRKSWKFCGELIEYFETKENKIWKRQTINTFLSRMIEKGIVVKHQHKYTYAHTKVEFEKLKATEFLENRYDGSLSKFVAALSGTKKISKEDADALIFGEHNNIKIMCKIENMKDVENIDILIEFSDGIMVARGDLLPNIAPILLPRIQMEIVNKCNSANKKVVVATEFFERFAETGIINRAELSDVALAYREGCDAIMLAKETGNTKYVFDCLSLIQKLLDIEYDYDIKGRKNI